jgi:phospholipid-binding lipoprotein MlaA
MIKQIALLLISILISIYYANASPKGNSSDDIVFTYGSCSDIDDPYEDINRKVFIFNSILDHFFLRPVAKGYRKLLNENTREKIGNTTDNIKVPLTMVNNVLQAEGHNALLSFWQFAINSTFGVAGTHDIAKARGLHVEPQTLGSTLASYGVGPGPYLILPFYGSTNFRDMFDTPFADGAMNPMHYYLNRNTRLALSAIKLVDERAELLPFTDYITQTSPDPYIAIRSAVHQRREGKLRYPSYYYCTKGRLQ